MASKAPFLERFHETLQHVQAPVCVGLDPDPQRIPPHLGTGVSAADRFLSSIIEATRDLTAAFKPNTAYFEAYGPDGWALLSRLRDVAGPDVLWIVDAKRGDIEHTNEAYAHALFDILKADAITAQPYAGGAALEPFYRDPSHGVFVLCATSNNGAESVQQFGGDEHPLYLEIARQAKAWSPHRNIGLVMGTTKPDALAKILQTAPELPLLLPGGGAQGGDSKNILAMLKQANAKGLFNFSRSVLYKSSGKDFADAARMEVMELRKALQ